MIQTYGELLLDLAGREREVLDDFDVSHRPTIGKMYEGLSQELLALSIPDGLDLKVVSGFVEDDNQNTSDQIDCMLVSGEGRPVPYTDDYYWNIRNVIAVFEIKKNLTKAELIDSFAHLNTVRDLESNDLLNSPGTDMSSVVRTFAQLTGRTPVSDLDEMPEADRIILSTLIREHHGPIRVAFGYHGYKTEKGFRDALSDHLIDNVMKPGFGVSNFPQLIISGDFSLAKINGEPYVPPLIGDGGWMFYASTTLNPQTLLLEYLWTRLDRVYGLPDETWGDDLDNDVFHALLSAAPGLTADGRPGWHYTYLSADPSQLGPSPLTEPWQPTLLSEQQVLAMLMLHRGTVLKMNDEQAREQLSAAGISDVDAFWQSLLETRLVARDTGSDRLVLLPKKLAVACLGDGQWVAGEDNTGRFSRWVDQQTSTPEPSPHPGPPR